MLARVLAMALCPWPSVYLSVCQSVTSRSSIETTERIGLTLALDLLSSYPILSYTVL